jgi:hypothetical protein
MRNGDKVGVFAVLLLLVAAALIFIPYNASPFETASLTLQWVSVVLLIFAGVGGSRWWFAIPASLLALWIWVISLGH